MHKEALASYIDGCRKTGFSTQDISKFEKAFEHSGINGFYRALLNHFKTVPASAVHFTVAQLHARLGEKDAAFELLEKAFAERSGEVTFIREIPTFNNLKSDPRYAALLRRVGLSK